MDPFEQRIDPSPRVQQLHASIREALPSLRELLEQVDRWYDDRVYRFYHGSFKVYVVQEITEEIVEALRAIAPDRELHPDFLTIVDEGTGTEWEPAHNKDWLRHTRPMLEAFFHARYFLQMVIKYGTKLDYPPAIMPSGWGAVLYLYGLRHTLDGMPGADAPE